ncbi:hypothetical protein C2E23DRAFT_577105 [Lenzites betulinus]|nr:hypothetical protein C2E23DRAFT_577105 [Lenzites betulinus]
MAFMSHSDMILRHHRSCHSSYGPRSWRTYPPQILPASQVCVCLLEGRPSASSIVLSLLQTTQSYCSIAPSQPLPVMGLLYADLTLPYTTASWTNMYPSLSQISSTCNSTSTISHYVSHGAQYGTILWSRPASTSFVTPSPTSVVSAQTCPLWSFPELMSYIYSQANLEELHLEMDDLIPPNMALPPSLRAFTVFPRLRPGTFREQDLTRITHLCLGRYGFEHFDNLAGPTVGAHLVSLRLGSRLGGTSWSLGEVAARFPRLRLLHVDMGKHINGPAMHPCPIDWRSKKREQLPHHDGEPHPPVGTSGALTVVWAYPHEDGVVLASAVKWHMFLNEVAFVVLRRWSPYVGRIVYRHTIIPYVCATLSHDQTRLIREKDVYMPDDYWKTV